MGLKIKLIAFIIGIIFFIMVLSQIKKRSLRPSYSFLWFMVSLFLISISVFEPFYRFISRKIIGISDTKHIIYIGLIGFLLVYVFYLTIKVHQISDQVQELISTVAIQQNELESLSASNDNKKELNETKT
ncbi:MAG TPA: DUF2304 domain-containing protein [Bacteroidales bacterium]|jgi:hypothetical protein|nr:DUF2304 domain-containing protein [Caldisericia bacterium]HRR52062.1 DUF2304 domain-containing protein [Bacteroidales bacterium]